MANIDELLKSNSVKGMAIGLGAALLAPVIVPVLAGLAKPLTRAAIKAGIIAYEKGREAAAEFGEVMEDLVAEARAELEQNNSVTAVGAVTALQAADMSTTESQTSVKANM